MTHVKYLESAGARVIPIDYTRSIEELHYMLENINGLYIPGDSKALLGGGDEQYTMSLRKMLQWAQRHNEKESNHFPVLGVGYGSLALIKSQLNDDHDFHKFTA